MPTTLTYGATVLTLPADMLWSDEYAWQSVEQRTQYSVTGALLIEATAKQAGRPITLQGGVTWAWMPRTTLETLRTWAALPAQAFTLAYRSVNHAVVFDQAARPIEASPVIEYAEPDAADLYIVTLRFLKV